MSNDLDASWATDTKVSVTKRCGNVWAGSDAKTFANQTTKGIATAQRTDTTVGFRQSNRNPSG
jgi:hypothetical protein